jgi:hypothetical protein
VSGARTSITPPATVDSVAQIATIRAGQRPAAHWFDEFTKMLARPLSRRDALRRLVSLGVGGFVIPHLGCAPQMPSTGESLCRATRMGTQLTLEVKSEDTYEGQPLTLTKTTALLGATATSVTVIRYGQNDVLRLVASSGPQRSVRIQATFGAPLRGARQAIFETRDGKAFMGSIDGRRLTPFRIDTGRASVQFADRRPPAVLTGPIELLSAIERIAKKAQVGGSTCGQPLRNLESAATPITRTQIALSSGIPASLDTQIAVNESSQWATNPKSHGRCHECIGECFAEAATCPALACVGFFVIACGLGAILLCNGNDVDCLSSRCNGVGGPCCPVRCGAHGCCEVGGRCLDSVREVCCGSEETPCRSRNCCDPGELCLATGDCCPPQQVCGTLCCKLGDICVDGVACCQPGQVQCKGMCCSGACAFDSSCCPAPSNLCPGSGVCCPPFSVCCGGQCCGQNIRCHPSLNVCCPIICGPNCCGANQFCSDPATGSCSPCPPGQHPCTALGEPHCCPDGQFCCSNGLCCPGSCCQPPGLPPGCYPVQQCIK